MIITLLTDFGFKDPFVGLMKAVILRRCPTAQIVDLCHGIAPQDVVEGAFWLEHSWAWFAPGTIHVAVVDPGVGSARAALAVHADGQYFVGPDNGLLSGPLARPGAEVRAIDLGALELPEPSRTFHGRDVFAPLAAELAAGRVTFADVGPVVLEPIRELVPRCQVHPDRVVGMVIAIDQFGNLITNIEAQHVTIRRAGRIAIAGREWPLVATYAEAAQGQLVGLVNAFSTLEIAVRNGSAARELGIGRGSAVELWGLRGA